MTSSGTGSARNPESDEYTSEGLTVLKWRTG